MHASSRRSVVLSQIKKLKELNFLNFGYNATLKQSWAFREGTGEKVDLADISASFKNPVECGALSEKITTIKNITIIFI